MRLPQAGHVAGLTRAAGYFDESKYLTDAVSGIAYLDFISDIYANFEVNKQEVIKVCKNCFGYSPCWCDNPEYVEMLKFVYEALIRTKGG